MDREVSGGGGAHIEVLVPPPIGRGERAALLPGHEDLVLALRPQYREALSGGDDDHDARPMAMRLLVGERPKHRHVGGNGRARKCDSDATASRASRTEAGELVPGSHVRKEIAGPDVPTTSLTRPTLQHFRLRVEASEVRVAIVPEVRVVEEE